MRQKHVLIVPHVGETVGSVVRGLSIADQLAARGVHVEFAACQSADWVFKHWQSEYSFHPISWQWSHNQCSSGGFPFPLLDHVSLAVADFLRLASTLKPDLVIGLPGLATAQAARFLGVKHIAVLYGPYLSPVVKLNNPTAIEERIITSGAKLLRSVAAMTFQHLSAQFGFPTMDYDSFLATETILVPHPGLEIPTLPNLARVDYVAGSYGHVPEPSVSQPRDTCFITFGSGNPCDIGEIIGHAAHRFPSVILASGVTQVSTHWSNVAVFKHVKTATLAGTVSLVISHGGIGTVGTFAPSSTPHVVIPTELDQATTAIHAARAGIVVPAGLGIWHTRPTLGRSLPSLPTGELDRAIDEALNTMAPGSGATSEGASEAADVVCTVLRTNT